MTVGISLTNGVEAIVLTDARGSSASGRQSDSMNKMETFSTDKYHGVLFGSGQANLLNAIFDRLNIFTGGELENFIDAVHTDHRCRYEDFYNAWMLTEQERISKEAMMLPEEDSRGFVHNKVQEELEKMRKHKSDPNNGCLLAVVAYDNKFKRIRQFYINPGKATEYHLKDLVIGSGSDAASLYLGNKMTGLDSRNLSISDIAFFVANAHSESTINLGVGGTPKLAYVTRKRVEIKPQDRTIAIANLSGAYLAELPGGRMTNRIIRKYINTLLNSKKPNYARIAKRLSIDEKTLTGLYIPYSSWQERANRELFKGKKG